MHTFSLFFAVIVEATYGVSKHLPREDREQRFLKKVRQALARGGRVLLPGVALGRAHVHISPARFSNGHSPWQSL